MRYLSAGELLSEEIDIRNVCVLTVAEPKDKEGIFENKKRHCSVLFLYLSGERVYTVGDGSSFTLSPGDILYVPQYASYRFRITEGDPNDLAIAINFTMHDKNGEGVCLGDKPHVLLHDTHSHYHSRFTRMRSFDTGARTQTMLLKSAVYSLCHELFGALHEKDTDAVPWRDILPAIDAIESVPADDIPIPTLARLCGVSETRFRLLFNQYTGGIAPIRYRNTLRMEQALRMIRTEQVTVERAAREAGFHDMSHFYRLYKKHTGKAK